jgi:AraC-like DNA-binding protein
MDPLTQFVELLRPQAFLWKRLLTRGDWAWRFPGDVGVVFGLMVSGICRFQLPGAEDRELRPGDYLLMAVPPSWVLRGGRNSPVEERFEDVYSRILAQPIEPPSDAPDVVSIIGGHFTFDTANTEMLKAFLTPTVHVGAAKNGQGGRLSGIFAMIDEEASANRPGEAAMLSRLIEIVLIELLRTPTAVPDERGRGMLAGLADPRIAAALRVFHADIRHSWSVASLARVAGMSRSVFSQRFTDLVGEPPMTYVLQWRMALARDALKFSDRSLEEIAYESGYSSASAFSTAFTRSVGQPPARFSRQINQNAR